MISVKKSALLLLPLIAVASFILGMPYGQAAKKPNILVIMGEDIGSNNISAYSPGVMGYRTPNIDRIANEWVLFTDHYAQPSCTAGLASFIMGTYPIRSGMNTVGMVGSHLGMQAVDVTLAEVLK
ncbi:sulfatase-like hydrolase/transferase [Colwellia sp. TT2012]|uniref:sulfatase-like hydrolase/transferase n=1 Tax=Colwellia sp. TT2012 TaxID=1720342 RepID=UPI000A8A94CF|nr:sulfatase-like hydrolase/transferase [Colwellia sp. TT2012]